MSNHQNFSDRLKNCIERDYRVIKCSCGKVMRAYDVNHHNFFCTVAKPDLLVLDIDVTRLLISELPDEVNQATTA